MKYNFDDIIDRRGTSCSKWDNNKVVFGTEDLHPMWIADMDFKAPQEVIDAMQERLNHGVFGYTFRGEEYNNSIVNWIKRRYNWNIENEWITFSPGIVPALSMAVLAYTRPGDSIVIQTPVYGPFSMVVKANGRQLIESPLICENRVYKMDIKDLEEKIDSRTKILMLCNPHNPVGRVWTKEELEALTEIVIKHDLVIVSDEIHSDFIFPGHKHISIASISKELEQRTVTCYAPSKTFGLAGLTTSTIIIPNKKLRCGFNDILESLEIDGGNIFGMVALKAAYDNCKEWLEQLLLYLEDNVNFAFKYFEENIPYIKTFVPDGTYLLWLDCRKLGFEKSDALAEFFTYKAKVGLNRGLRFGNKYGQYMRMNIACPRPLLEEGLRRIDQAVKLLKVNL